MKTSVIIPIILVVLVLGGGLFYVTLPKDKCVNVNCDDNNPCTVGSCNPNTGACSNTPKTCPEEQECNVDTGSCEIVQVEANALDKIEQAISDKIKTEGQPLEQPTDAMK